MICLVLCQKQEIQDQISKMQQDLKTKHEQELSSFLETQKGSVSNEPDMDGNDEPKKSRQQKRKEKKAMQMRQAYQDAKEEAGQSVNYKQLEESDISNQLKGLSLKIKEIPADGHCMYSAIADQLGQDHTFKEIRSLAASYMRDHPDDFLPFMTNDHGEMLSPTEFKDYCEKIESTAEWGGQIELQAISKSLNRAILVVQMGSSVLKIGEEYTEKPPICLSYHRHAYGLGEHYNSLTK